MSYNQVKILGIVSCKRPDNSVKNYIDENLWTKEGYQLSSRTDAEIGCIKVKTYREYNINFYIILKI